MWVCTYIYIYIYVCVCVCVCVQMYIGFTATGGRLGRRARQRLPR